MKHDELRDRLNKRRAAIAVLKAGNPYREPSTGKYTSGGGGGSSDDATKNPSSGVVLARSGFSSHKEASEHHSRSFRSAVVVRAVQQELLAKEGKKLSPGAAKLLTQAVKDHNGLAFIHHHLGRTDTRPSPKRDAKLAVRAEQAYARIEQNPYTPLLRRAASIGGDVNAATAKAIKEQGFPAVKTSRLVPANKKPSTFNRDTLDMMRNEFGIGEDS